jgi:hypothetical protein
LSGDLKTVERGHHHVYYQNVRLDAFNQVNGGQAVGRLTGNGEIRLSFQ